MIKFPPMENHPTPTLYQIVSTDYLAQNLFVTIFGPWVVYFLVEYEYNFDGQACQAFLKDMYLVYF